MRTIPRRNGLRSLQTTVQQVCNTCWHKKHRLPHKATQTQVWHHNFEESFSTWEFELARYERDNNAQLPDQVKIAVLMNETTGPLQQHLHLNASATPTYAEVRTTIMEYYRTTTAFSRLQQQSSSAVSSNLGGGPAPMDIGATYKGKGRGKGKNKGKGFNKGGHKGKGYQQGKGYGGYGSYNKGKGKGKQQQWYQPKGVEKGNKGKSKGIPNKGKGKNPTTICYRCGQQGHLGKGLPNSGVQHGRDTTGTEPGWNIPMVWPKQWVWQLLVQHRPVRQLQHSASPTTTTASFASTINKHSNTQQFNLWEHWAIRQRVPTMKQPQQLKQCNSREEMSKWTSRLTVVQQHMCAHHGLHQTHHCIHCNMDKDLDSEQQ